MQIRRPLQCAPLLTAVVLAACSTDPSGSGSQCVVTAVTVTGAPATLQEGATAQLAATLTSQDCATAPSVSWSSNPSANASVSASGLVTGLSAGGVTVTATAGGISGSANIQITPAPVAVVAITPDSLVLGVGTGPRATVEARDAGDNVLSGRTVTWSSLDPAIATVAQTGVVTGVSVGDSARIVATVETVADTMYVHVIEPRLAFAWNNNQATAGTSTPSGSYAYNSAAGTLEFNRSGTGTYSFVYGGLNSDPGWWTETVFTSVYAPAAAGYCRVSSWGSSSASFTCHGPDGTPADARVTIATIGNATLGGRSAHGWMQSASSDAVFDAFYRWNPSGQEIRSEHLETGRYRVRFVGLGRTTAADREAIYTSAYGGSSQTTCQPATWSTDGDDLLADVGCFDPAGVPTDSRFTILLADRGRPGATFGFVHADQPAAASYTPTNSAVRPTGNVTVTRSGTGIYEVEFEGFFRTAGLAETYLVTAVGNVAGRCQNQGWSYSTGSGSGTLDIRCYNLGGVPTDLAFVVVALQ